MANKPLKSIKFPGLPDTYVVPQIDDTLMQTGQAADAKVTGDKITGLKEDLSEYNSYDILRRVGTFNNITVRSVTYTWNEDKTQCAVSGTASGGFSWNNLYYSDDVPLPPGMVAGKTYRVLFETTNSNIKIEILHYLNGATSGGVSTIIEGTSDYTVPDNCTKLVIRLRVYDNTNGTGTISKVAILNTLSNSELLAEIAEIDDNLLLFNSFDILHKIGTFTDKSINGIDFVFSDGGRTLTITGTASALATKNIYYKLNGLPFGIEAGKKYYFNVDKTGTGTGQFQIYFYNGSNAVGNVLVQRSKYITIPDNADGLLIRAVVFSNAVGDCVLSNIGLFLNRGGAYQVINNQSSLENGTDLNDVKDNSVWFITSDYAHANKPEGTLGGTLLTFVVYNFVLQIFIRYSGTAWYKRYYSVRSGVWGDWIEISGTGTVINQIFNDYQSANTYNTTPTITTDTNNYLAPSGDQTDVSASIMALLNSAGVCNLAPGDFYVSHIDMPENTALIGSGPKTRIILLGTDSTEGYAIKMASRCTVKNMMILGNTVDHTPNDHNYPITAELVNRHGILWEGNYSSGGTNIQRRGIVSDCYIANFTGGGIACYNNGMNVISGLNVTDCIIWYCYAGVYIPYVAEFNRFSNVVSTHCHYGVINNGGNNCFVNCNFSKNIVGFLLDNTNEQAPNNAHGSVSNCIFDHSDGNTGVGIHLIGVSPGEVFTGCQLFYSKIVLENCNGVNFIGLNAGRDETITIIGGSLVMFNQCVFRTAPTIEVSNNDKVKFNDCFTYTGVVVNP